MKDEFVFGNSYTELDILRDKRIIGFVSAGNDPMYNLPRGLATTPPPLLK